MGTEYYYEHLSKAGQRAYYAMKQGLERMDTSFQVPLLSGKELTEIYYQIRMDHPEIFYTVSFKYRYYQDSEYVELFPEYLFPKNKIKEHRQAMEARVKKLARQAEKLDEKGKELFIHDFICQNVHYDKLKKPYSHEIIGALGHGVGVCEGIAKSVKILCDALKIWCIVVLSENNPDKGIKYRHAWNLVKIGGKYYHLDCTFDNTISKTLIRYDYVNLDDSQIFRDHEQLVWRIPESKDHDHFYYKEKKLSFTKMEEVRSRAMQAAKKNKPLVFHWRGGYLTREVLKEILQILEEEGAKKEKHPVISLNWAQAVIQVQYEAGLLIEETEPEMEQTNEGELYDAE